MTKSSTIKYRPDIDGLRCVAVMSVLLYHAFPTLFRSGYVGVDIFFVISGFLITTILRKEIRGGTFSVLSFYKKRIRRIYPALIITLLGVVFLSWFLLSTSEFRITLKHVIFSSLFSENFLLWSQDGYFDKASIFKPTLHIWSLSIEEQFYIFWPLIIAFLMKKGVEVKGILIFITASFLINIYDISNNPAASYYSPLGRSWELMVGSLFSVIYTDRKEGNTEFKGRPYLAVLGLVCIVLSIFLIPSQQYFPGFSAIPVVLGSALVILYGENTIVSKLLSVKSIVFVGLISYPLYLIHWPLMSFSSIIIGHASYKANALCLLAAFVIAVAIYYMLEKPISRKKLNVAYSLFSVMVLIPVASFILMSFQSRINEIKIPTENEWTFLRNNHSKFGVPDFNNNGTGIYTLSEKGDTSYLFIGDSHIANLAEFVYDKSNNSEATVRLAAGGGCIPIPNVYTDDKRRSSCWDMRESALNAVAENGVKNVVFGGAWYMYFFSKKDYYYESEGKRYLISESQGRDMALKSMMDTIKDLTSRGKTVLFIKDAPYIGDVEPQIYRVRLQPFLAYDPHQNLQEKMEPAQVEFINRLTDMAKASGAKIINIFDNVCSSGVCKLTDDGEYVYADSGHFNPAWLRKNESILRDLKI